MKWIMVYTAQGESEAIVIRSVLESNGIKIKEVKESVNKLYALSMDGLGKIDFYVPEDMAQDAKDLLASKSE